MGWPKAPHLLTLVVLMVTGPEPEGGGALGVLLEEQGYHPQQQQHQGHLVADAGYGMFTVRKWQPRCVLKWRANAGYRMLTVRKL